MTWLVMSRLRGSDVAHVMDDELAEGVAGAHVGRSGHGELGVTLEEDAVLGAVVDGEDEAALEAAHLFGQGLESLGRVVVVTVEVAGADIRRVEEEERLRRVVDGQQLLGGSTLEDDALHAATEGGKPFAQATPRERFVEPAVRLAKGRALEQIEEARGAEEVGLRARFLDFAEDGAAAGQRTHQPQEFAGVVSGATVDVAVEGLPLCGCTDELAVEVVEHLEVGGTLGQEHRRAAREGLHVGFVGAPLDEGQKMSEKAGLSARPTDDGHDPLGRGVVFWHRVVLYFEPPLRYLHDIMCIPVSKYF